MNTHDSMACKNINYPEDIVTYSIETVTCLNCLERGMNYTSPVKYVYIQRYNQLKYEFDFDDLLKN